MIDLYGLTSPNVQKIFIMLEECGLPYNFKPVDVWASAQHSPEFEKLNPNKKIPVIVDTDGPGGKPYTVFEFGRDPDVPRREDRQVHAQGHGEEIRRDPVADDPGRERRAGVRQLHPFQPVRAQAERLFAQPLQDAKCCGSTSCSTSGSARRSISAATNTRSPTWRRSRGRASTRRTAPRSTSKPNFKRWFEELSARPAVKTMIAKQADIKSSRETATDDNKDRFFNRGKYARA